ncbi:uncharacterized protein LOC110271758 isoform X1 [Arachis ipaensis]|uniref:uncharacterized protein LOC110271758 isoform X1 n=1 Tax=Arachis ipaensis TaxID=130454 RepID=UPI000A2B70E1|nr:uncharacterized protein LOC110271758 isoform X1 [Arachis ipaensis]
MASLPSPWLGSHRREPSLSAPPSGLPPLLPPENTSAGTEIYRCRRCRSSDRRFRSRWLPELPPNRFSDRRCFIFLVRLRETVLLARFELWFRRVKVGVFLKFYFILQSFYK